MIIVEKLVFLFVLVYMLCVSTMQICYVTSYFLDSMLA